MDQNIVTRISEEEMQEVYNWVDEIAKLKAQLAAANLDKEIAEGKLLKEEKQVEKQVKTEPTPEDLALMELRGFYKEVLGKNVPFRYQNDADWMHKKIDVAQKEN